MEKLQPILNKLKGVVDHLEKIILGVVLLAVAVTSVLKLLSARGELDAANKAAGVINLGGQMRQPEDIADFAELVLTSREDPPAINLDGTNHLVFNAAKWNRIVTTSVSGTTVTNVFRDSQDLPLGVSALRVTEIREVRLLITPKIQFNRSPAKLGENNMRYRFEAIDEYPSVFASLTEYMAYWRRAPNWQSYANYNTPRMQSFMPQKRPFPANTKALSPNLQPHPLRKLSALHLFNDVPGVLRQYPDWFVGFRFTAATKADRIEDVICTLDIVHGLPGGGMVTNKNRVAKHNQPISFTRGYEADLFFQTKFTAQPMEWKNCRVGRRFSVDGEVFRIIKVIPDLVQLVSDQGYGGNRQIYDKPFRPGPVQVRPGLNIPVPGGGTNAASPNAVPARPPVTNPPAVGGNSR
ncbi:MAG: hypothetical protein HOH86_07810 [Verrucomicrobiales bacterium]|nr:hypothetical protein [Verrucomicrobiales bacterium]